MPAPHVPGDPGPASSAGLAGSPYRGRFAPSPSGDLHFGSVVAAVGSYLDARAHDGQWLLRIEDLDPPRERPGAADRILRTLEDLGLEWDGPVLYQSTRTEAYATALAELARLGLTRACTCSRAALAQLPQNRDRPAGEELFHPAECVAGPADPAGAAAVRMRVPDRDIEFEDRVRGAMRVNLATASGDFVLKRRDGPYAYQLAVIVDDAAQAVTDVVRGVDLLSSTPKQVLLQQALGYVRPAYLHLPLAVDHRGRKLSKSEDAPDTRAAGAGALIAAVLEFLGQEPPGDLGGAGKREALAWGVAHWQPDRFAGFDSRRVDSLMAGDRTGENSSHDDG